MLGGPVRSIAGHKYVGNLGGLRIVEGKEASRRAKGENTGRMSRGKRVAVR